VPAEGKGGDMRGWGQLPCGVVAGLHDHGALTSRTAEVKLRAAELRPGAARRPSLQPGGANPRQGGAGIHRFRGEADSSTPGQGQDCTLFVLYLNGS